jgi:high affinity Mn2+ porin
MSGRMKTLKIVHNGVLKILRLCNLLAISAFCLAAQDPPPPERWNLYFQATSIGQTHPPFFSPYEGVLSLRAHGEAEVSLTSTLYLGLRLAKNTQIYFDPEVAGGRGFSNTNGVANFPNGEMPRVATATPKPYLARLYITQDFGFSDQREKTESGANQLGGSRPMTRYSITVGRFTVTDFFDFNRYSHDPRTQFMGWAVMYNGAWDYSADTRGYTWGWMHEFRTRQWSFRYASVAMPRVANGLHFDRQIFRNRGDVVEVERRNEYREHEGAIRLLYYRNHANAGTYAESLALAAHTNTTPDIIATRRPGTLKYGFGLSVDQEVWKGLGVFGRLGWNNGKTESFAFTALDSLATAGVSVNGACWKRPDDTVAAEVTTSGISGVHATYLSRGGLDFLIGDGALHYGRETIAEAYYSARLAPWFFTAIDLQHITNPAYNRDRGPVWVLSLRLHTEFGKK